MTKHTDIEKLYGMVMKATARSEGHRPRLPINGWSRQGHNEAMKAEREAKLDRVVDYVRDHPGALTVEIAAAMGISKAGVQACAKDLIDRGRLENRARVKGKSTNRAIYYVVEAAK